MFLKKTSKKQSSLQMNSQSQPLFLTPTRRVMKPWLVIYGRSLSTKVLRQRKSIYAQRSWGQFCNS